MVAGHWRVKPPIIDVGEKKASSASRQIFGFLVAGHSRMSTDTLREAFMEFTSDAGDSLSPNMAVLLSGGLLTWGNVAKEKLREIKWSERSKSYSLIERSGNQLEWKVSWSAEDAEFLRYEEDTEPFRALIRWIAEMYRAGETSDVRRLRSIFPKEEGVYFKPGEHYSQVTTGIACIRRPVEQGQLGLAVEAEYRFRLLLPSRYFDPSVAGRISPALATTGRFR